MYKGQKKSKKYLKAKVCSGGYWENIVNRFWWMQWNWLADIVELRV